MLASTLVRRLVGADEAEGARGRAWNAVRRVRRALADLVEQRKPWRQKKLRVDRAFDTAFGVDTSGITHLTDLVVRGPHQRHAVKHVAMDPDEMQAALAALTIAHEAFTFVDLGSGKARAVLLASLLPFRRIVGVEFAEALHAQGLENVRRFRHEGQRCRDIELHCMDAADYVLPDEPLVLFMYHPFGAEVMDKVIERARASLVSNPRALYVLYANPFLVDAWLRAGFRLAVRGPAFVLLRFEATSDHSNSTSR